MSEWLIAHEGTQTGLYLSMALALAAAVLHAIFGALQKGRHDPWLSRAGIDAFAFLMALPVALFVVPWPERHMVPILAGVFVGYALAFVFGIVHTEGMAAALRQELSPGFVPNLLHTLGFVRQYQLLQKENASPEKLDNFEMRAGLKHPLLGWPLYHDF